MKTSDLSTLENSKIPNKKEMKVAEEAYQTLIQYLQNDPSMPVQLTIEGFDKKVEIPVSALPSLIQILEGMIEGYSISNQTQENLISTQEAARLIGCSRPFMVKLLEEGEIEHVKIGKHRRVALEDLLEYKKKMKIRQKKHLMEMMQEDEDLGLYDSQ